jgi:hypothetical protein
MIPSDKSAQQRLPPRIIAGSTPLSVASTFSAIAALGFQQLAWRVLKRAAVALTRLSEPPRWPRVRVIRRFHDGALEEQTLGAQHRGRLVRRRRAGVDYSGPEGALADRGAIVLVA